MDFNRTEALQRIFQVIADKLLHEFIAVDLAYQAARVVVVGDISGVF